MKKNSVASSAGNSNSHTSASPQDKHFHLVFIWTFPFITLDNKKKYIKV